MILNPPPPLPVVTGLGTVDEALAALEAAVAERGAGYIYPNSTNNPNGGMCMYVDGGQPSCLIGLVLHRAGVPLEWFTAPWHGDRNVNSADHICRELGIDPDVTRVLRAAQVVQDRGGAWGTALEKARAAATYPGDVDEVAA